MLSKLFARLSRPAWAAAAVVALLAIALAFPSVRAAANSFLGLFRVQQFSIVQVDPGNLPDQLGSSTQFEAIMSQDVQFDKQGEVQQVASAQEASDLAGFAVRLPADISGEQKLAVQPGGGISMKVNLQHVRALLDEIGRSDIQLPAALDGATVSVDVPKGVVAMYGSCQFDAEAARQTGQDPDNPQEFLGRNCTTLVQLPSPSVEAPPGLDMNKIGEAYLQVMGLSPEEAAHFAQNVDWTSTFVIPIPRYGTTYREVQVDGVTATLIERRQEGHPRQYMLMWVKDGMVYALTGPGQVDNALTIANSLQ
jgi:hypothetical protein